MAALSSIHEVRYLVHAPLAHKTAARIISNVSLAWNHCATFPWCSCHLVAKHSTNLFMIVLASLPNIPSTDVHNCMKHVLLSLQALLLLIHWFKYCSRCTTLARLGVSIHYSDVEQYLRLWLPNITYIQICYQSLCLLGVIYPKYNWFQKYMPLCPGWKISSCTSNLIMPPNNQVSFSAIQKRTPQPHSLEKLIANITGNATQSNTKHRNSNTKQNKGNI